MGLSEELVYDGDYTYIAGKNDGNSVTKATYWKVDANNSSQECVIGIENEDISYTRGSCIGIKDNELIIAGDGEKKHTILDTGP